MSLGGGKACLALCAVGGILAGGLYLGGVFSSGDQGTNHFSPSGVPSSMPVFPTITPTSEPPTSAPSFNYYYPSNSPTESPTNAFLTLFPTPAQTSEPPTWTPSFRSEYPSFIPTESPPTMAPSKADIEKSIYQYNDSPYYYMLTSESAPNSVICYDEPCHALLEPKNEQALAVYSNANAWDTKLIDYDVCSSTKYGTECVDRVAHIQIQYDAKLSPLLTNTGGGMFSLWVPSSGDVYIQEVKVPTTIPTKAPVTKAPTRSPTTNRPSPFPSILPPSVSSFPTSISSQMPKNTTWIVTWTAWPPYPTPNTVIGVPINEGVMFVGEILDLGDGSYTLGGFGTLSTNDLVRSYADQLWASNILPVASIGGGGGQYDFTWDLITSDNTDAVAEGMNAWCIDTHQKGLEFDYEAFKSQEQESLVGTVMGKVKALNPELLISLDTNAGTTWQTVIITILDAAVAKIPGGGCPIDELKVMAYTSTAADIKTYMAGWKDLMTTRYGCPTATVVLGLDKSGAAPYNVDDLISYGVSEGFGIGLWYYDPARPS